MQLRYFASLREQLACSEETLNSNAETIEALLNELAQRGDLWTSLLRDNARLQIAVNQAIARRNTTIKCDDEIAFFPPVTGG
ncbi:MAG: molybdopterin converting factor subunit 1 [Proteobacteria bacterium]|nr:molybdopterin converting factor subunit 1 [Pseudomonadota bacterium]